MQKGNIGVTTENIFPIIKKFLYSDHEIFLRELVSNAVDATQKKNTRMMQMLLSVISDLGSIQHLWSPRKLKSSPNRIEMVHKL